MPEVLEALAIGQDWDGDVRIVLFVRLQRRRRRSTTRCATAIRRKIRAGASPRHVPAKIVAVADIPRTKSGKITELAVRDIVHGRAGEEHGSAGQSGGAGALSRIAELAARLRQTWKRIRPAVPAPSQSMRARRREDRGRRRR